MDGKTHRLARIPCPLCGARDERLLYETGDRLHSLSGRFRIVCCKSCSLIYINPRPTREALSRYYPEDYFSHRDLATTRRRGVKDAVRRFVLRTYYEYPGKGNRRSPGLAARILAAPVYLLFKWDRRNALVIPYQGEGRFLDVGCGSGKVLAFMQEMGWQATGLELDPDLARRLREEEGLDVVGGEISSCSFTAGSYDVIHLSHVLEHLPNPVSDMERIFHWLKKGGRLYLRLPDWGGFAARRFRDRWFGLDVPRHLCTYTRRTVARLLTEVGFKVEYIKQDRNSSGLRNTLRSLERDGHRFWPLVSRIGPLMGLLRFSVHLLGMGDAMIIRARKD